MPEIVIFHHYVMLILFELRNRLVKSDTDVCTVQKSMLRRTDKTPSVEGYGIIGKTEIKPLKMDFFLHSE